MPDSTLVPAKSPFAATFAEVVEASHAPGYLYSDPQVLAREKEVIFKRDWLCLCRAEELAEPGDYITFRIVGEPLLLCKDKDGAIKAYANMCLHRGVELANGQGKARAFSCPYHGWTYDLEGRLRGAGFMQDSLGFEKENCRLPEFQVREWCGWVFVSLAEAPRPFEDYIATFDAKFGWARMQDMRLGLRMDAELNCNWKLMVENFIDFYHVKILHKDTIGRFMKTGDVTYDLCENGQVFIDEYDAGTLSKTGDVFRKRFDTMVDKSPRFSATGLLPPNVNIFFRPDYVSLFTSWPLGPGRMKLTTLALWHKDVVEAADFEGVAGEYKVMLEKVLGEDFDMVESLQNAAGSGLFEPGRMSRLERGVQHFVKYSIAKVFEAPKEP